jgi:hypothetical protein
MTLPFDATKPETRAVRVVFYTDDDTSQWLNDQADETELGVSLLCHRIAQRARESATPVPEGERRQSERRSA